MKNLLILFCFIPILVSAQKNIFEVDKVDDMTGAKLLTTKYFDLKLPGGMIKFRSVDKSILIDIWYSQSSIFSIDKGSGLIFKLNNDSTYKLFSSQYYLAKNSVGVYTIESTYESDKEFIETLEKYNIVKIRIYFIDSYIDMEVNQKRAIKIQEVAKAFNNRIMN